MAGVMHLYRILVAIQCWTGGNNPQCPSYHDLVFEPRPTYTDSGLGRIVLYTLTDICESLGCYPAATSSDTSLTGDFDFGLDSSIPNKPDWEAFITKPAVLPVADFSISAAPTTTTGSIYAAPSAAPSSSTLFPAFREEADELASTTTNTVESTAIAKPVATSAVPSFTNVIVADKARDVTVEEAASRRYVSSLEILVAAIAVDVLCFVWTLCCIIAAPF
jgi:hypothetical protein